MEGKSAAFSGEALLAAVPQAHKDFASGILTSHGVEPGNLDDDRKRSVGFARNMPADRPARPPEVAFRFPIRPIANALGVPARRLPELGQRPRRGRCTPCPHLRPHDAQGETCGPSTRRRTRLQPHP